MYKDCILKHVLYGNVWEHLINYILFIEIKQIYKISSIYLWLVQPVKYLAT